MFRDWWWNFCQLLFPLKDYSSQEKPISQPELLQVTLL